MAEGLVKQECDLEDISINIQSVYIKDLVPGDHIAICRKKFFTDYYHHGIFLGLSEGVVDFGTNKLEQPRIRQMEIEAFIGGKGGLCRVNYPTGSCVDRKATIAYANELLHNRELWGPYNLVSNNCEHFAMRCKTGKHVSLAVVKAMRSKIKKVKLLVADSIIATSMR